MTAPKSTKNRKPRKPSKSFPLWANSNGQWARRINGRVYYFGTWDDPNGARQRYLKEVEALRAGRKPRDDGGELTIKRAINIYLSVHEEELDDGEISPEHFSDLKRTLAVIIPGVWNIDRIVDDLDPDDFRKLKRKFGTKQNGEPASPSTMMGHIRRTKAFFSWLCDEGEIDRTPRYGAKFGKLTKRQQVEVENTKDEKQFTRDEILQLLETCDKKPRKYRMRAMVLLGINAAMGPRDIAELTKDQIDLENGWLVGKRSKTAVRRCVKLWPETVAALQTVLANRFEPNDKQYSDLVFITRMKRPYLNKGAISLIFGKLKANAGINGAKRGFYVLRHVCRDVANQLPDRDSARWIMGHKRSKIDDQYTRTAPRNRIEAMSMHVRQWLFGGAE